MAKYNGSGDLAGSYGAVTTKYYEVFHQYNLTR